jgi:hypothetical protein
VRRLGQHSRTSHDGALALAAGVRFASRRKTKEAPTG